MAATLSPALETLRATTRTASDNLGVAVAARPALIQAVTDAVGAPAIAAANAALVANQVLIDAAVDTIMASALSSYQAELVGSGMSAVYAADLTHAMQYALLFSLITLRRW